MGFGYSLGEEIFIEWQWGAGGWGKTTSFLNQGVTSSGERKHWGLRPSAPRQASCAKVMVPGGETLRVDVTLGDQVEKKKGRTETKNDFASSFLRESIHSESQGSHVGLFHAPWRGLWPSKLPRSWNLRPAFRVNGLRKVQMGSVSLSIPN